MAKIFNSGNKNTGHWNTGNKNTGNWNTGHCNTGNKNTGNWNTGHCNTGNCNTGNKNTGNWNTGHCNTGNCNTGDCNTGNWNTGSCNTGDGNTGDWNTTNYSCGVFCTEPQKILIFDKPSNWTLEDWWNSEACELLSQIQTVFWVSSHKMTAQEKELHPEHETTGGYLKTIPLKGAAQKWWDALNEEQKNVIRSIPNFNADKFYKITGIRA